MEKEPRTGENRQVEYPSPHQILEEALARIESDGTVLAFDEDYQEPFALPPHQPIPLDSLPYNAYQLHLLYTAGFIAGTCLNKIAYPGHQWPIDSLAHHLTAYYHDPGFLQEAVNVVKASQEALVPFHSSTSGPE